MATLINTEEEPLKSYSDCYHSHPTIQHFYLFKSEIIKQNIMEVTRKMTVEYRLVMSEFSQNDIYNLNFLQP